MEYCINRVGFNRKELVTINRPHGTNDFVLILFKNPVFILSNRKLQRFDENTCILYPPNATQYYTKSGEKYVHSWVHFAPQNPDLFKQINFPFNIPFHVVPSQELDNAFSLLEQEYFAKSYNWEELSSCILHEIILRLQRGSNNQNDTSLSSHKIHLLDDFKNLRLYINKHLHHSWTIKKMAQKVNLCPSRFSILYKEFFEISPMNDLINMRIQQAQHLLLSSDATLPTISELCGYESEYHFIRQFKQKVGCTPRKYSKNRPHFPKN